MIAAAAGYLDFYSENNAWLSKHPEYVLNITWFATADAYVPDSIYLKYWTNFRHFGYQKLGQLVYTHVLSNDGICTYINNNSKNEHM